MSVGHGWPRLCGFCPRHRRDGAGPRSPGTLLKVLDEQSRKLWHIGNGYTNEPVLRLARGLESLTFAERAFFANSGAEANEAALKLARRVAFERAGADKVEILSFTQSFHGRTLFTVSVGGQPK